MKKTSSAPHSTRPCHGCGEIKPLINSHIVPECFCKLLSKPGKAAKLVSSGEYAKRSPIGVYDPNILCLDCEKKFGVPDDYAFAFLHGGRTNFEPVHFEQSLVALAVRDFDYRKLKLFVLSVLWRASISTTDFCNEIRLSEGEKKRLRDIVLYGEEPGDDEFPICCGKVVFSDRRRPLCCPVEENRDNVRLFRISTGEFYFWVKIDTKPWPQTLSLLVARPGQILYFTANNIEDSPEMEAARRVVRQSKDISKGRF
jgi:hypothetical protein